MSDIITKPPKSVQLATIIRQKIEAGELSQGERILPMRKIAEQYSLSTQVAQSAFAILEKEGLIKTHVGRGTFVSRGPELTATKTVVLLIDGVGDSHNPLPVLLPAAIQRSGLGSYVFDIGEARSASSVANFRDIMKTKPRAIIIDACSKLNASMLDVVEPPTKLIFIRRFELKEEFPNASFILEDFKKGGQLACDYLLARKRKKIALITFAEKPLWMSSLFRTGIEMSLQNAGLALFKHYDYTAQNGEDIVEDLSSSEFPDGFLCIRDYFYECVDIAAKQKGLSRGKDFDGIGYGNTPWAQVYGLPSLDPDYQYMIKKIQECLASDMPVSLNVEPVPLLNNQRV